jgi:hypothetical protein
VDLDHVLRCTLAVTKPRISKVVKHKQYQPSHKNIYLRNAICDLFSFSEQQTDLKKAS